MGAAVKVALEKWWGDWEKRNISLRINCKYRIRIKWNSGSWRKKRVLSGGEICAEDPLRG